MELNQVKEIVEEVNSIHLAFSKEVFQHLEPINLAKSKEPELDHVLTYRLHLHESINDYLMQSHLLGKPFVYRVKTSESILYKRERFLREPLKTQQLP